MSDFDLLYALAHLSPVLCWEAWSPDKMHCLHHVLIHRVDNIAQTAWGLELHHSFSNLPLVSWSRRGRITTLIPKNAGETYQVISFALVSYTEQHHPGTEHSLGTIVCVPGEPAFSESWHKYMH